MSELGFGLGAKTVWRFVSRRLAWVFRAVWRLQVEGAAPEGPCVIAANHYSHLDPALVGYAVGPMRYLAVDELYGNSEVFDWFTVHFGAIPMSRVRVPLGAMKEALRTLASGGRVGVFPEGRRVWTWGEVAVPKRGAAWLAHRAGVPLVPVAVWGTQYSMGPGTIRFRPAPVALRIGPGLDPGSFDDSRDMMTAWCAWMDDAAPALRRSVLGSEGGE